MERRIRKVAVLGSGIMGSRIAAHMAGVGVEVMLLDIVPRERNAAEEAAGVDIASKKFRNRLVNDALQSALKSNPSPIYHPDFAKRISTGNFEDDMPRIKDADWIIEVVVERLDIKKTVFEQVEKYRKPGTLVSSNTSGIPIHLMLEGRSEDFRKHFLGTHFFNPPRYLKLLEIIPTPETLPEVVEFFMHYGDLYLGKSTVLCKDTPAFIANRVGIYSIMSLFHQVKEMGLTVEEVDKLTGPVLGRPKSATFRTTDVVGLDTLVHVANGLKASTPNDEMNHLFALPTFIEQMQKENKLGSKTGEGFYKKVRTTDGGSEIQTLDLDSLQYRPNKRASFKTLEATKPISELKERLPILCGGKDKAGNFYRKSFAGLFAYVSNRVPEIADELFRVDEAMKAGFGWELGPFEYWDAIGLEKGLEYVAAEGLKVAAWIGEMQAAGANTFYQIENGKLKYYDPQSKTYKVVPGQDSFIILDRIRPTKTVWQNAEAVVEDLGDGVLNIEFRSKMNTLGGGVIQGINKAFDLAEKDYRGLVIGNQAPNFSVGANLGMIFMMAIEQDYDELNMAVKIFQDTVMRVRYSAVPVVVAPHGMTLGGGCEMTLHADRVVAAAETYIGLVEFGVGVIPGGGGTKELTLRAADRYMKDDVELNTLRENYLTIGMAKVATSAHEAYGLGILRKGQDEIVLNKDRQIAAAKSAMIEMSDAGYTKPVQRKDIKVLGRQALGMFEIGAHSMVSAKFISEHDRLISRKLAYVMSGGDLSEPTLVSEQYLLDLEREAFLSLCGERKTLERIQHMLKTGKPLRN
jgi:3-hydroxyacyl-CoA dehydrogenase